LITKKGEYYFAIVYAGKKDGKDVKKWSKGFKRKKDAVGEEIKMKAAVRKAKHKVYDPQCFGSVARQYLDFAKRKLAETTYRNYEFYYAKYLEAPFAEKKMTEICKLDLENFKIDMADYSAETYNKAFGLIKKIFDFAIDTLKIMPEGTNPCGGVKRRNVKLQKVSTWNPEQIAVFLGSDLVKSSPYRIGFQIIFSTGMRPGEVCGLQFGDIDGDYINLDRGLNRYGHETDMKNDYAHESVFINEKLKRALKIHSKVTREIMFAYGHRMSENDYILSLEPDFRPLRPEVLSNEFRRIRKKLDLPAIRLYDARHSLATNMMRDKVNPKIVSEIMRHSSVKTTLDRYSHPDDDMKKEALSRYVF
jgi:integrase